MMTRFPAIGEMRHRITFQKSTQMDDGYGGGEQIWTDIFSVWASVEPISGREYYEAMAVQHQVTHRIKTRYRSDVTPEMRVTHDGKIYGVESVVDIGMRHRFLEILCREQSE